MEKMMKKPEVEAVRFEDADVIATSSLTLQGFNDVESKNGTVTYNGNSYDNSDTLISALKGKYGGAINDVFVRNGSEDSTNVDALFTSDESGSNVAYDGTYYWYNTVDNSLYFGKK